MLTGLGPNSLGITLCIYVEQTLVPFLLMRSAHTTRTPDPFIFLACTSSL
ncbi:hypothetical protein HanPI659440_Chr06g0220401 [Helianthus annuus]|nr:hypothetical protein HanPI659440_Chr06g0220401 [Helianthus annuus]